ncbi:hypothetical protein ACT2CV_07840 [Pasteurellaceae bacterium 22721_9_1]
MKIRILLLTLLPFVAHANDPFDKNSRDLPATINTVKTQVVSQCHQDKNTLLADTNFKQLKMIGILIAEKSHILLLNDQQVITTATIEDFIGSEGYQLAKIDKNEAQFKVWKKDCINSEIMKLKL